MSTLQMTVTPFGTAIGILPAWMRPAGNSGVVPFRVAPAEDHNVSIAAQSGFGPAPNSAGRQPSQRVTLLAHKTEETVLRMVEDPASRQAHALPAVPAMDPSRVAEQEQLKRLALACLSGDPAAWRQLVASQHRRVYGICYRFTGSQTDAEDLTQEVFLKLYRSLASFDPAKGAFQTWITTLTRNLLVDHFRRTRQERATDSLDESYGDGDGPTRAEQIADLRSDQHGKIAQLQLRAHIQHALRQISPELREAVILRDLQDMDYKEIAQVLRVPEGTVKSRISRGRSELARILQRDGIGAREGRMS